MAPVPRKTACKTKESGRCAQKACPAKVADAPLLRNKRCDAKKNEPRSESTQWRAATENGRSAHRAKQPGVRLSRLLTMISALFVLKQGNQIHRPDEPKGAVGHPLFASAGQCGRRLSVPDCLKRRRPMDALRATRRARHGLCDVYATKTWKGLCDGLLEAGWC